MNLNCETVLDVYTYKNRKFLCQIKVDSNSGKFKNCRCLSQEQWMEFDKNLEKLVATIDDWNNEKCLKFNINPCIVVKIQKSNLSLKHFKTCLGTTLGSDGDLVEANCILECIFVFKREFLFSPSIDSEKHELPTQTLDCAPLSPLSYVPYTPSKKENEANIMDTVKTPGIDFLEYNENSYSPKPVTGKGTNTTPYSSESNRKNSKESDGYRKKDESISPEKVKSSKFSKTRDSRFFCPTEETKLGLNSQTDNFTNSKKRPKSKDRKLESNDENATEKHKTKKKKLYSHHGSKLRRNRLIDIDEFSEKQKNKTENIRKESHTKSDSLSHFENEKAQVSSTKDKHSAEKRRKNVLTEHEAEASCMKKTNKSSETPSMETDISCESAIEISPNVVARRERKLKLCSKDTISSLRRSERSPSKPKRFVEEQSEHSTKSKKNYNKIKELSGADDDEDALFETKKEKMTINDKKTKSPIFETPVSKKPVERTSSSSSKKNKRSRDRSAQCQQEKLDMSNWLSKRNSKPLDHKAKATPKSTSKSAPSKPLPLNALTNVNSQNVENDSKSCTKSETPPPITIELPSKEELELMKNKTNLMREENAKIKAELDKMRTSPPKEVDILSLENIPEDNIISTFVTYKDELDEIYQNNRNRDYIKGHDGINHCFIIRLLQPSIQMKMLEKLTDVYGCSNSTRQATLFANALLPEWVIRVYMEKFSFNRQQAIDQIKAQEAFQLHMDEQNENSFGFD